MAGGRRPVPEMPEATTAQTGGDASGELPVFASQEAADNAPGGTPLAYEIRDPNLVFPPQAMRMIEAKDLEIARLRDELSRARPALLSPEERAAAIKAVPPARRFQNKERDVRTFIDASGRICRMLPNKILDERLFPIDFIRQQGFDLVEVGPEVRQVGRYSFAS